MKEYRWELHLHTLESSRCARSRAADMVEAYHALGFEGIVVTDHFVNGNSRAPAVAPWKTRIDGFLAGYRAARRAGEACGLRVLLGWEYYFEGGDFLTYGLDEDFLYAHEHLADLWDLADYVRLVREAGGCVVQAHPFRTAWYMPPDVRQRWDVVDALEVYNGSHAPGKREWDERALALARRHRLPGIAGSDAHSLSMVNTGVMAFPSSISTGADLVDAIRQGRGRLLRLAKDF